MTTIQQQRQRLEKIITLPATFQLVGESNEIRNRHMVTILRYQKDGLFVENGPRVLAIFRGEELISLKNLTQVPTGTLPTDDIARKIAEKIFLLANRTYARDLSFIRIEHQTRDFMPRPGLRQTFPVLWIKFGHRDGSYNWVTLSGSTTVIEMEFDSHWDYFRGRRKTEMWDNDDWVAARNGRGPQMASPNALA